MPLNATRGLPFFSFHRTAVGVWMDAGEEDFIGVFASCRALEELEPNPLGDPKAAVTTFTNNRQRIEDAASAKFDRDGADEDDQHEGKPVLMLRADDIPDIQGT